MKIESKDKIIKIDAIRGISLKGQLQIIADFIGADSTPTTTPVGKGHKIESRGRRYHVSCKETPTTWSFKIWWGV